MPNHRKPRAMRLLHGDRANLINTLEPIIKTRAQMPKWLPQDAKREWRRLMDGLGDVDLVTGADQALFSALCVAIMRWRQAEQIVQREGEVMREPIFTRSNNFTGRFRLKRHPALAVAKERANQTLTLLRRFGLTPADRHRLIGPVEIDNALDEDDLDHQFFR